MKKISKICLAILICFTFASLNIDGVRAVVAEGGNSTRTCKYGIICKYHLNKGSIPVDNFYDDSYLVSYYQCKDKSKSLNECKSSGSYLISVGYAASKSNSVNGSRSLNFWNYNDIFYQTDKYKDKITAGSSFKCPNFYFNNVEKGAKNYIQASYNDMGMGHSSLYYTECIGQNEDPDFEKLKDETLEEAKGPDEKSAPSIDDIKKWGAEGSTEESTPNLGDCSIIGQNTRKFLNEIFSYISVGGIIIVIIMSILDGIKVITASEDGAMGNFLKGLRVRIICLVLLLVLPMLVTFIVSTINNVANIAGVNSDNPLCGVTK